MALNPQSVDQDSEAGEMETSYLSVLLNTILLVARSPSGSSH